MHPRPHPARMLPTTALALAGIFACGGDPPAAPSAPEAPPPATAPSVAAPTLAAAPKGSEPAQPVPGGPMPEAPKSASVSFLTPADGGAVKGIAVDGKVNVPVKMKVDGMKLEPAGAAKAGSGHHHIIIDGEAIARDHVIPADDKHLHFGKAQSDALVPLAAGAHKLTLQFADGLHRSYGPTLSDTIEIRVMTAPGASAPTPAPTAVPAGEAAHEAGH